MPRKSETENVRKICGCAKWKTCSHPWYLDYQRDKQRFRDNLDKLTGRHAKDFSEAKDEARRAIVAKLEGHDPSRIVPQDDPTLAGLLAEYGEEKPPAHRWRVPTIIKTEVAGRRFGDYRLSTITHETLQRFKAVRPLVAGNRDLALLRAAFNWAVLRGILPRSPFRIGDVPAVRLAREEPRSRRLQAGEEERVLEAAGGLRDVILAALETGCRKGELLSLQWHQVRFSPRAELFLPGGKTKSRKDRRIPISTVLAGILTRRRLDPAGCPIPPDGYVFGDEIGRRRLCVKSAWWRACKRAKIPDLHFHDLRREAGSRWMDAGIPLATIQRWLGHSNIAVTSRYLGASLGADADDMRKFEERIGRVPPLTFIDVSDRSMRQERTQSANGTSENINNDGIGPEATGTIH